MPRSPAPDSGPARRTRRYGWRRPRWRDRAFWAAVGLTVVLVAVQVVIADRDSPWAWAGLALRAVVTWVIISACIRIRIGIRRGLVDGFRDAQAAAAERPSGTSRGEEVAKAGGRLAGRALGAARRARR